MASLPVAENPRAFPRMKAAFTWLDAHPGFYWATAWTATTLLGLVILWSVRRRSSGAERTTDWVGLVGIGLFVLAWRWPFLLSANEYNPDESQLIAGAMTLAHDPVFWRSVDGTTSGPLNFYLLVPYAWLGLPLDYFTARLTGLLLIVGALGLLQRTLAANFGRAVAWLAVLPATVFFATITYGDLIHYSSEHLSLGMTALAIALVVRPQPEASRWALASAVMGAAVWAKLQVAPLAVVVVGAGLWHAWRRMPGGAERWRAMGGIVFAALAPTLIVLLLAAATDQLGPLYRRYIVHNFVYVGEGRTWGEALVEMTTLARKDGRLPIFLQGVAVVGLIACTFGVVRRVRAAAWFGWASWLVLAAALAVVAPRREFLHYALLLIVPLTFWLGAALAAAWRKPTDWRGRLFLAGALLAAGAGWPLVTRARQPRPEMFGQFAYHWSHPRTRAAALVREIAGRNGTLGIWGWASQLYVETGLTQATRDAHSVWSIAANAQRDYHRASYLDDLKRHAPAVFVDAVGPGAFAFADRGGQGHEQFPELAAYVASHYDLLDDLGLARIYGRKDGQGLRKLTDVERRVALARGRLTPQERQHAWPAPATSIEGFQRKQLNDEEVVMLLPPARVEWDVPAATQFVWLNYGFDPVAWQQGQSNGAEMVVECRDAGGDTPVFRALLEPANIAADRQPQAVRLRLPDSVSPRRLIVRTEPGAYGDTAWDWVYLARVEFEVVAGADH